MNPKQIRKSLNLTQRQMAQALGITLRHYQRIEAGAETSESVRRLLAFIQATRIVPIKISDVALECRQCFSPILKSQIAFVVVVKDEKINYDKYKPFCSIKCAITHN